MNTSYREQNHEYGKSMIKMRNAIGLTQGGLGKLVGVSWRSVAEWEAGRSYPKTERLKALIELAVQHQAFSTGSEAEEIRQLWKVAHQKVPLDEDWLCVLLSHMSSTVPAVPQRLEAETIGTPSPAVETGSTQESGSVQDTTSTIGARPHHRGDQTRGRHKRLLAIVITLVILVITGAGGMLLLQITPPQTHTYPGYLSGNGTLAFFDPLSHQDGSKWTSYGPDSLGLSCQFTAGAYHVSQQRTDPFNWCPASGIFSNFAFEVQLTITQGDCGGMLFRMQGDGHFYNFTICQDGRYKVNKYISYSGATTTILQESNSSAIRAGLGKPNKMAVVVTGSSMTFYVNERQIDQEQDSSYTSGKIALISSPYSRDGGHATDVAYSNARLWTL